MKPFPKALKPLLTRSTEDLAHEVNELHLRILSSLESTIQLYKQAGDSLRAIKEQVGHGQFTDWLSKNFKASKETARGYMRVSENWKFLSNGQFSTLSSALHALRVETEQPAKQEQAASWARKRLRQAFQWAVEHWTDEEAIYLADLCTFQGRPFELLDEKLHAVREEIAPLVEEYMKERESQAERRDFVGLVTCGGAKKETATEARHLYKSPFIKCAARWMDQNCKEWYILSAKHGLLPPDKITEPYDVFLDNLPPNVKKQWAKQVWEQLPNNRPILFMGKMSYLDAINDVTEEQLPITNAFDAIPLWNRGDRAHWLKENPVLTDELAVKLGVNPPG